MSSYPLLFQPFEIAPLRLKNRITLAPLFTMYAKGDGSVSELMLAHYSELAKGGVAMMVVANAAVDSCGLLARHSLRADSDRFIPGLSRLAETIKKEGVAAVLQINHGGRFARSSTLLAPSAVPLSDISLGGIYRAGLKSLDIQQQWAIVSELIQYRPERIRVMTKSDIRRIIQAYADKEIMEKSHQPCYMVYLAQAIKQCVSVPVVASGRIVLPNLAEGILREDKADLIGLARPLFADPLWPQKAKAGQPESISACIDCGACFQFLILNQPVRCNQWGKDKRIHRQRMIRDMLKPPKKILIALDGSENAALGAVYAGDMLAGRSDVLITLLHVCTAESSQNEEDVRKNMEISKAVLTKAGIPAEAISVRFLEKKTGVARDILDEIEAGDYGTVIVGRRGLSRAKQFLFGSVSNKIVHNTRDCTVWVVD